MNASDFVKFFNIFFNLHHFALFSEVICYHNEKIPFYFHKIR